MCSYSIIASFKSNHFVPMLCVGLDICLYLRDFSS